MRKRPSKTEPPQFLCGWKDIASYLGKGVRTVQRYERQMSLPVRRPAGKSRGSVVATKGELDAWVGASPIREIFQLSNDAFQTEYDISAKAIKDGMAQMARLHDQMLQLRKDVNEAAKALRSSVRELQGGLNWRRWIEPDQSLPSLVTAPELGYIENDLDLPAKPKVHRKAS